MNCVGSRGFALVAAFFLLAAPARAQVCTGNCGTSGANGDVPLAPGSVNPYQWISTSGGLNGIGQLGAFGGTNGSTLLSAAFTGNVGDILAFSFNFVTSDGTLSFQDYTWARLLDASMAQVALLFTARTHPSNPIVPGTGLPAPAATLNPSVVTLANDGATNWSPLGGSSGACFGGVGNGCGNSGWVGSTYALLVAGTFFLQFGVTNFGDTALDSGLAFDGLKIGDVVIGAPPDTTVPEPATMSLMALGLIGIAGARFWRRRRA